MAEIVILGSRWWATWQCQFCRAKAAWVCARPALRSCEAHLMVALQGLALVATVARVRLLVLDAVAPVYRYTP